MKMKILLCYLCMWFAGIGVLNAEEEPVILNANQAARAEQDKRSIQIVPTAFHDGRTIYIRLDWPCDRLYVEVEDADGMTVFAGTPDSLGDTEYSFEIPGSDVDEYTLWIAVDNVVYVGKIRTRS